MLCLKESSTLQYKLNILYFILKKFLYIAKNPILEIINVDNSILQQFTATGGIAIYGNFDETNGGGFYIKNSNLTLKNINVIENVARNGGTYVSSVAPDSNFVYVGNNNEANGDIRINDYSVTSGAASSSITLMEIAV